MPAHFPHVVAALNQILPVVPDLYQGIVCPHLALTWSVSSLFWKAPTWLLEGLHFAFLLFYILFLISLSLWSLHQSRSFSLLGLLVYSTLFYYDCVLFLYLQYPCEDSLMGEYTFTHWNLYFVLSSKKGEKAFFRSSLKYAIVVLWCLKWEEVVDKQYQS